MSPGQLVKTGREVLTSTYFAKFADKRELMALVPRAAYDLSSVPAERTSPFVVDYVADTGDGFNATYAVACSVTRETRVVAPPDVDAPRYRRVLDGCTCQGPMKPPTAGNLLVFGGDEVYPVANVTDYDQRFKDVYGVAAAAGHLPPVTPNMVAIPGNHDWYDGLVAFRRNFCESWIHEDPPSEFLSTLSAEAQRESVAAWEVFQSRSYYAVKLPHHWWLWGIDIQLDAFVDAEQLDYFRRAARELRKDPAARLILATARPTWCDDPALDHESDMSNHQTLTWFIERKLDDADQDEAWQSRLRLVVTGDKHHYARYHPGVNDEDTKAEDLDNHGPLPEFVTCGGGGAYLSSTHRLPTPIRPLREFRHQWIQDSEYTLCRAYPRTSKSKRMRWRAWLTPFRNPSLIPFIGVIYALLLFALAASRPDNGGWLLTRLPRFSDYHLGLPTLSQLAEVLPFAAASAVLLGALIGFAGYGASGRTAAGIFAGVAHWTLHLGALTVASAATVKFSTELQSDAKTSADWCVLLQAVLGTVAFVGVFGLLGAWLMGIYLFFCDSLRLHENEVFATFRYEGYKSHLRIHVDASGLHVRAIGIRDVPKKWNHDGVRFWPVGAQPVASEQIDAFVIKP